MDFDQTVMDGRHPTFSVETREKAIAACSLMKQKEHNWKAKDIKAYCKEFQLLCRQHGMIVLLYRDNTPQKDAILATPKAIVAITTVKGNKK